MPKTVFTSAGRQADDGSTRRIPSGMYAGNFKSDGTAGWGELTAELDGKNTSRTILCYRVRVEDSDKPQLLRYRPDSDDSNLSNPKLKFTIVDEPNVGTEFQVVCTIYSLNGHEPIAQRDWLVTSAGEHTKSWDELFSVENNPGEGIYPFQITVKCTKMNEEMLRAKKIKSPWSSWFYSIPPVGSDWKASQTLTIKPRRQEAWSLSYDEDSDTTKLAYIVDVHSTTGKEPQVVRVDVYDPELNKVGEVTNQTIEHTVVPDASGDGKTFTYYFNGPVKLDMAGDYHFVVEAQSAADDPTTEKEDKDAGKWAIEQNSSAKVPTYVTFGGKSPAIAGPGLGAVFGQSLDTGDVSIAAANRLHQGGYKARLPKPKPWWATDYRGVYAGGFSSVADVVGLQTPTNNQLRQQPIQYNAVWLYAGHGWGGKSMAVWNPAGGSTSKNEIGVDDPNWSFLSADGTTFPSGATSSENVNLSSLPYAKRGYWKNKVWYELPRVAPLGYARLVCFIGCDTADYTGSDLPSAAVRMGARNAIGMSRPLLEHELVNVTKSLFDYLQPSKTKPHVYDLYEAAKRASYDTFGDYRTIRVAGKTQGSGVFGANFGWGWRRFRAGGTIMHYLKNCRMLLFLTMAVATVNPGGFAQAQDTPTRPINAPEAVSLIPMNKRTALSKLLNATNLLGLDNVLDAKTLTENFSSGDEGYGFSQEESSLSITIDSFTGEVVMMRHVFQEPGADGDDGTGTLASLVQNVRPPNPDMWSQYLSNHGMDVSPLQFSWYNETNKFTTLSLTQEENFVDSYGLKIKSYFDVSKSNGEIYLANIENIIEWQNTTPTITFEQAMVLANWLMKANDHTLLRAPSQFNAKQKQFLGSYFTENVRA